MEHTSDCNNKTTQFDVLSIYGPTQVVPGRHHKEEPSICDDIKPTVDMYCDVNRTDVHPVPSVIIQRLPDGDLNLVYYETLQDVYRFNFSSTSLTHGTNNLICLANNTVFNQIGSRQEFTVFVNEPPMTPPKMFVDGEIITDGKVINASLGSAIEVACRVEGGYPNVTSVMVECDGENNNSEGTESAITIPIQRGTHQAACTCRANHTSECYQKTAQFSIEVWEPASITRYALNSRSQSVELMTGSTLTFLCQAEGIPSPNISIKGLETGKNIPVHITTVNHYTSKIELTKPMACDESDSYVCASDNGIATQSSLDVFVTCPPQMFVDPTRNGNNRKPPTVSPDGVASVVFDIICRPPPIRYRLIKIVYSGRRQRRDGTGTEVEIDPSQVQGSYNDINTNRGRIDLSVLDTDIDDVNEYRLGVDNGLGDGIQIEFETVIEEVPSGSATSGDENAFNIIVLSVVSITAILIVLVIIAAVGYYITNYPKGHTKTSRNQRTTNNWMNDRIIHLPKQRY